MAGCRRRLDGPMSKVKGFSTGFGLITIATGVLFGTLPRNWIELFFRADPDGGSGILEVLFALALVAMGAGIVLYAISQTLFAGRPLRRALRDASSPCRRSRSHAITPG